MAYVVKVNLPNTPAGELVEVAHLGMFPNGEETEVADIEYVHRVENIDGDEVDVYASGPSVEVRIATWEAQTGQTWPKNGVLDIDQSAKEPEVVPEEAPVPTRVPTPPGPVAVVVADNTAPDGGSN